MKILFAADVTPNPNSGAAGTEYQTIHALRRLGYEVDEIWRHDLPHRIKHGNLHYLLELPKGYCDVIRKKWRTNIYDVVHVNQGHAFLAAKDHLLQKRPGIFVCRSHGLEDRAEAVLKVWRRKLRIQKRSLLKSVPGMVIDMLLLRHQRLVVKYVQGYIVSCSMDRQFLIDNYGFPQERIACIPQAPPNEFLRSLPHPLNLGRIKRILHIGGFNYWKGPHTVAAAINALVLDHPDLEFTWICEETDHLSARALLTQKAEQRTLFLGWVPQDNLLNIYDQNGIFLCPSFFEGFGKVFLEAMARGLCVMATKTGGMLDIIKDGENGYLVDFADAAGMVEKIRFLWRNHASATMISKAARNTAKLYSWNRVARETAEFYQSILEGSTSIER